MSDIETDRQGRCAPAVRRDRDLLKLLLRVSGHAREGVGYVAFLEDEAPQGRLLLRMDGSLYVSETFYGPGAIMCAMDDNDPPMTHKGHDYVSVDWLVREVGASRKDMAMRLRDSATLCVCRFLAGDAALVAAGATPAPAAPAAA